MNKLSIISVFIVISLIITSCGTQKKLVKNNNKTTTEIKPIEQKIVTVFKDEELKNWQHTNPSDSHYPGMSTEKAYNELLGNLPATDIVVAVIDAGLDINHPDLKPIIWTNENEIPNNGVDDDKNGFIDDIHGWNFLGAKDGKMAENEQLELTRIVAKYRKKWQNDSINNIAEKDKYIFGLYKKAEKELATKIEEDTKMAENYKMYLSYAENIETFLKNLIKTTELTQEKVRNFKTSNEKEEQAKMLYLQGLTVESIKSVATHFENSVKYNLNVDFNGRIQGDNPDDITDLNYGNGNVIPNKEGELHATHVAGIIAQVRGNKIGGNGVADHVKIMSIRAVPDGDEYDKDVALAIRYAVDNGAKVINSSFGKYYSPHKDWVWDAIKYAEKHDVLIVNAAGNDGKNLDLRGDKTSYPNDGEETEIVDNFLTVGAIGPNFGASMVAPFSNYGKEAVDVFSPGEKIYATVPFGKFKFLQGTSMAAPNVAGVAAILRSRFPKLTASQVKHIIMDSGLSPQIQVIVPQEDNYEGETHVDMFENLSKSGNIVNLYNAILAAQELLKQ